MKNHTISNLIDKSTLSSKEKNIIRTHIEICEDEIDSLRAEILYYKDIIDYGKYINSNIMRLKEELLQYVVDTKEDNKLKESYNIILNFSKQIKEMLKIIDETQGKPHI